MGSTIKNVITLMIILTVVSGLTSAASAAREKMAKGDIPQNVKKGIYTIQYGKGIIIGMIGCLLVSGTFFTMSYGVYFYDMPWGKNSALWVVILFGIFCLVELGLIMYFSNWKLEINKTQLLYRNMFGFTKEYTMSDIDHAVEKKSGEVVVYGKKGRLFSIQEMAPQVPFFSLTMEVNGITVIYK